MVNKTACAAMCGCVFVVGIILMASLMAESHVELGPNLYGIRYGKYNKKVYPEVETANRRYWLGPGDEFITFPSTAVTVEHGSLECFTADRVELTLTLSFQYSIQKEALVDVLLSYGQFESLHRFIFVLTRDSIRDVCSAFMFEEFYTARGSVEAAQRAKVEADMNAFAANIDVGALQLQNVHLPPALQTAISEKEDAIQSVVNAQNARQQVLIQADTDYKTALQDKEIALISASADAQAAAITAEQNAQLIQIQAEEQATAELAKLTERGKAFSFVAASLGVNGTAVLPALRYLVNTGSV